MSDDPQKRTLLKVGRESDYGRERYRKLKESPPESPEIKACKVCGETKSKENFWKNPCSPDGLFHYCKSCHDSDKKRAANYKRIYGISLEEFNEMNRACGGLCEICGKQDAIVSQLSVDHCHKTGRVRGLLCRNCNLYVGKIEDEVRLKRALDYLSRKSK